MAENIKEPVVEPELEQASAQEEEKATEKTFTQSQLDEIIQKEKAKAKRSAEKEYQAKMDEAEKLRAMNESQKAEYEDFQDSASRKRCWKEEQVLGEARGTGGVLRRVLRAPVKCQEKSPHPGGEGLGLVCVVQVCASKLWFAGYHDSQASEGIFVGFLKDDGAVCL